jgi:predicted nucleotidyltransferase
VAVAIETQASARARLLTELATLPGVQFALLFGSRAGGRPRPDSDWDIAIHFDPTLSETARRAACDRLIAALEPALRVDLIVLNDAPALLAHRALQGEKLIVNDQTAYVRFFVRTLALSGDEQYWRDFHAAARRKRLEEGRFGRP